MISLWWGKCTTNFQHQNRNTMRDDDAQLRDEVGCNGCSWPILLPNVTIVRLCDDMRLCVHRIRMHASGELHNFLNS